MLSVGPPTAPSNDTDGEERTWTNISHAVCTSHLNPIPILGILFFNESRARTDRETAKNQLRQYSVVSWTFVLWAILVSSVLSFEIATESNDSGDYGDAVMIPRKLCNSCVIRKCDVAMAMWFEVKSCKYVSLKSKCSLRLAGTQEFC